MKTDLTSHKITGYSAHGNKHIDLPLISEILPNLWMGGCIGGVALPQDFDYVFSLYVWEKYKLGPHTEIHEFKAYDSLDVPDLTEAVDRAYEAHEAGKKILIHCQAGLNRSGLVTAQVLMKKGYSADEAISLLREQRGDVVLCNPAFEEHLRGFKVPDTDGWDTTND